MRYSSVAQLQAIFFFVYDQLITRLICLADLLIASKINFSFKKCQPGH